MVRGFIFGCLVSFAGTAAVADPGEELELAVQTLDALQPTTFHDNAEYCGYIGRDASGTLVATTPTLGGADWCEIEEPVGLDIVASYHTHAGYDPNSWSEIPSGADMESDENLGIDGYVSTPGGRLWYIDTEDMVTSQICGIGCLAQDPNFRPASEDNILQSYTYDELVEKIDE